MTIQLALNAILAIAVVSVTVAFLASAIMRSDAISRLPWARQMDDDRLSSSRR